MTWPPTSPEELAVSHGRAERLQREGAYAEAAAVLASAARTAARIGLADLPASRWLDRGLEPGPTWLALRAQRDVLLGAAAVAAGRPDDATPRFAEGLAAGPLDVRVQQAVAYAKGLVRFDLDGAEAAALRAIELERRQSRTPSERSVALLRWVQAARASGPR